jgi:hypothetical protein
VAIELKRSLGIGGKGNPNTAPVGAWRFFGKISTAIAAGGTGTFEIWNMATNTATGQTISGVKNPGAAAYPSDTTKIVGITRCGFSGVWVLDTEYCA